LRFTGKKTVSYLSITISLQKEKQTNKNNTIMIILMCIFFFNDHRENDINTVRLKTHGLFGRFVFVFISVLCFVFFSPTHEIKNIVRDSDRKKDCFHKKIISRFDRL